jgi:hypothetical protein
VIKLSKTVTDGDLVTKHGDKFVRCGKHRKWFGVYQTRREQHILTDEGMVRATWPAGIVVYGVAEVKLK